MLIGRAAELAHLREHLSHHRHTLLVGPVGIGKSALVRAAVSGREHVIVEHLVPFRPALLSIAQQLYAQGRLTLPDTETAYLDWSEVKPHVTPLNVVELLTVLAPLLTDTIIVIDDLDGITPTTAKLLGPLFEQALVVGAITTVDPTPELAPFFWHFHLLPLGPLPREEATTLLWSRIDRTRLPDAECFEAHALEVANGTPLALVELARQAQRQRLQDPADITALTHDAGIRYVDLTPALLVIGACAVAARFLALGLNDIDTYILAGIFGAFFLVSRYFLYRAMRGRR